jgi:hypothetical protein
MLRTFATKHDLLRVLTKPRPLQEAQHLWTVLVPRRSITGRLLCGTVLRRRDVAMDLGNTPEGEPTEFRVRAHQSF